MTIGLRKTMRAATLCVLLGSLNSWSLAQQPQAGAQEEKGQTQRTTQEEKGQTQRTTSSAQPQQEEKGQTQRTTSSAQPQDQQRSASPSGESASRPSQQMQQKRFVQASELIGMSVRNDQGENLGKIEHVALELDSQRVPFAALTVTGMEGVKEKTIVVPFAALEIKPEEKVAILAASKQQIQQAEEMKSGEWPERPSAAWGATLRSRESAAPQQSGTTSLGQDGTLTLRLNEEELRIEKKEVPAGGVIIRKTVETEEVTRPVELRRERIEIEKLEPGEPIPEGAATFQEREIYIPLTREEAVVNKEAQVREIVRVRKTEETEQKNVEAQLRSEDVEIQRQSTGQTQRSGADTEGLAVTQSGTSQSQRQAAQSKNESPSSQATQSKSESPSSQATQSKNESPSSQSTAQKKEAGQASSQGAQLQQVKAQLEKALTQSANGQDAILSKAEMQKIEIRVEDGTATLKGTVQSQEQKRRIVQRAMQVEGVRQVEDQLKVKGQSQEQE